MDEELLGLITFVLDEPATLDERGFNDEDEAWLFVPITVSVGLGLAGAADQGRLDVGMDAELAEPLVSCVVAALAESNDERLEAGTDAGVFGPMMIFVLPGFGKVAEEREVGVTIDDNIMLDVEVVTGLFGPIIIFEEAELVTVKESGINVETC